MIFGRGHRWTRRQALTACGGWLAGTAFLALAGCGGGDSGSKSPTPPPTRVTLTGRVIDIYNSGAGVQGAQFLYGAAQALTDSNGNFTLQADPSNSTVFAKVIGPTLAGGGPGYHGQGTVSSLGDQFYNLNTDGFPIAATSAGQTVDLGTIRIGNIDGPPFPPF